MSMNSAPPQQHLGALAAVREELASGNEPLGAGPHPVSDSATLPGLMPGSAARQLAGGDRGDNLVDQPHHPDGRVQKMELTMSSPMPKPAPMAMARPNPPPMNRDSIPPPPPCCMV